MFSLLSLELQIKYKKEAKTTTTTTNKRINGIQEQKIEPNE